MGGLLNSLQWRTLDLGNTQALRLEEYERTWSLGAGTASSASVARTTSSLRPFCRPYPFLKEVQPGVQGSGRVLGGPNKRATLTTYLPKKRELKAALN